MNLLLDPLFRVRLPEQTTRASLPELLALLGEDRVDSLPGLQRHQEDAFHIFLCYLAGAVLDRQGQTEPRQSAEFWLGGIRALTQAEGCESDDAWTLVVDDPTRPAFLQAPAPSRAVFARDYKPKAATPDALDVLQTAKNHDIKTAKGDPESDEAWAFALISSQTMTGLLGKGNGGGMNRGISRMNSGIGSRPRVGWLPSFRKGRQFTRDVGLLLELRARLLEPPFAYQHNGKVLLWLNHWDGMTGHSLRSLDPYFIEIARRYRLAPATSGYQLFSAGSAATFIAGAEQLKGNMGDPWIPINLTTNGALTVVGSGLYVDLLRKLIFPESGGQAEFKPAAMQEVPSEQGSGWIFASVLARGNGTTDGFHETAIRVPEKVRITLFAKRPERDRLAIFSKQGLEMASNVHWALRSGLITLMTGGATLSSNDQKKKREVNLWADSASKPFSHAWDPLYFDWLWTTLDQPDDAAALKPWFELLRKLAETTLEQAFDRVPLRSGRNYRGKTRARGMFYGSLHKHFKDYMEANHEQP
jgi:CRISPR system Cascade subunit CasA